MSPSFQRHDTIILENHVLDTIFIKNKHSIKFTNRKHIDLDRPRPAIHTKRSKCIRKNQAFSTQKTAKHYA